MSKFVFGKDTMHDEAKEAKEGKEPSDKKSPKKFFGKGGKK